MKRARLTVSLSKASTEIISVAYATKDGTAIAGTDYTAKSGTLTFAPGVLTQDILIEVSDPLPVAPSKFSVDLTSPTNATLLRNSAEVVLTESNETWLDRFTWTHDLLTDTSNGFFGPTTGPNAYTVPYHAKERAIIVEAPDWTHESVSETVSFWAKLEAWNYLLTGDAEPLTKVWDSIEKCWIPSTVGQPWGDYTPSKAADYIPDAVSLTDTPVAGTQEYENIEALIVYSNAIPFTDGASGTFAVGGNGVNCEYAVSTISGGLQIELNFIDASLNGAPRTLAAMIMNSLKYRNTGASISPGIRQVLVDSIMSAAGATSTFNFGSDAYVFTSGGNNSEQLGSYDSSILEPQLRTTALNPSLNASGSVNLFSNSYLGSETAASMTIAQIRFKVLIPPVPAVRIGLADPLYTSLTAAYGTKSIYLMHWLLDVDGDYGFRNPDGTKVNVFINNFQRGPVEDGLATITHPCYDDYANGGGPYGFQPIYNREKPVYPDSTSTNGFSKQYNYSMAGDADVRVIGNTFLALRDGEGTFPTTLSSKASKMAAYLQYTLYDKYFQPIPGFAGDGCHYLLSWGCGWGVGALVDGATQSYWGFRIGNSEIHHGYNGIDVAYAARSGAELAPTATGVPARWSISLDRQLELLRWLQTPEGAIAGGVSSNWRGRYETPTDGRQNATFYGCYYNHSPSWFAPFSNNWTGFQFWGMQRVSEVAIHAAEKGNAEESIYTRCMVLLDKWIPWFFNQCEIDLVGGTLSYPINSSWVSTTPIAGVTASEPALRFHNLPENPPTDTSDVYEYLPSLNWPGSNPDYATFWSASGSVPNPNLKCIVTELGWDPGTAAGAAQVLLQYCQAKKIVGGGVLSGTVPNTDIELTDVLQMAVDIMEFIWNHRDDDGFGKAELMKLSRLNDVLWIPPEFGTHNMPKGEILANGVTTFKSMRQSFYSTTAEWSELNAWLDGGQVGDPPSITYHRFWNGVDVGVAFGMIYKYFPEARATA